MNCTPESEQLQQALNELATAMTRVICVRVDQAVAQIMSLKSSGEAGASGDVARGTKTVLPLALAQKPAAEEEFIDKHEVARRLGKTLRTVDNWMARGVLPHYKIGRSVNFRWSDVLEHLTRTARVSRYHG